MKPEPASAFLIPWLLFVSCFDSSVFVSGDDFFFCLFSNHKSSTGFAISGFHVTHRRQTESLNVLGNAVDEGFNELNYPKHTNLSKAPILDCGKMRLSAPETF